MSEWISVKDKLPDNRTEVLIAAHEQFTSKLSAGLSTDERKIRVAWFSIENGKTRWMFADSNFDSGYDITGECEAYGDCEGSWSLEIIGWMPLPNFPKEMQR